MGSSKKYKNKLCVYCRNAVSTTADHVFPREIFQKVQRAKLPKVPSCEKCNNKKSQLEHYLLTVLPFGGTHANAQKALSVDVKKRLVKNQKLHRKINDEYGYTYIPTPNKILERRMFVKYDNNILHEFVGFVGCGLMWFHWGNHLPLNCAIKIFTPSRQGLEFVNNLFYLKSNLRVDTQLGDGTIRYKGVMSEVDDGVSIWAIQLFGGITIADPKKEHVFRNSFVAMITGDIKVLDNLTTIARQ